MSYIAVRESRILIVQWEIAVMLSFAKPFYIACLFIFIPLKSNAQNSVFEIVQKVQENNTSNLKELTQLGFSGRVISSSFIKQDYFELNDIPFIEEYIFDGLWIKPDSIKILVKGFRKYNNPMFIEKKSTKNGKSVRIFEKKDKLEKRFPLPNPVKAIYSESAMTESIDLRSKRLNIKSTWPIFPFSENSEKYYTYKIIGRIKTDLLDIVEIEVTPIFPKIPGVAGIFQIDALQNIVIGGKYYFNEAAKIKEVNRQEIKKDNPIMGKLISINEYYTAEFKNAYVNSIFWLPIQEKEKILLRFMGFDAISKREIQYTNFILHPDKKFTERFSEKNVTFQRDTVLEKTQFLESGNLQSISADEFNSVKNELEESLNSTKLEETIFDTDSYISKIIESKKNNLYTRNFFKAPKRLSEYFSFNRVEGFKLRYGISLVNPVFKNTILSANGGYGFSDKRYKGELNYLTFLNQSKTLTVFSSIFNKTGFFDNSINYSRIKNSAAGIIFNEDYRDYYYKKGFSIGLGWKINDNIALNLSANSQNERSADKNTDFSIFDNKRKYRLNPEIVEGNSKTIDLKLAYIRDQLSIDLKGSIADKSILESDFEFKTFYARSLYTKNINQKSRFRFLLESGFSSGELPVQRVFYSSGKILFDNLPTLRGLKHKELFGDHYYTTVLEFIYKPGIIFDLANKASPMESMLKVVKFVPWVGFSKYEYDPSKVIGFNASNYNLSNISKNYYEIGLGIMDQLNILRFDVILNNSSDVSVMINLNFLK